MEDDLYYCPKCGEAWDGDYCDNCGYDSANEDKWNPFDD